MKAGSDFSVTTSKVNDLIIDYLNKNGMNSTLKCFEKELHNSTGNDLVNSSLNISEKEFLKLFTKGEMKEFFKHFESFFPSSIKRNDFNLSKLEFLLHIYFSIYPVLKEILANSNNLDSFGSKQLTEMKDRMNYFKLFLDTKEIELSNTTDYLAYYALPYIPNPIKHPTFQKLFTRTWYNDLLGSLKSALKDSHDREPALISYVSSFSKLKDEIVQLKTREESNKLTLIECQIKWSKLSLEIIKQSNELCTELDKLTKAQNYSLPSTSNFNKITTIREKLTKYEMFVTSNLEELKKSTADLKVNG